MILKAKLSGTLQNSREGFTLVEILVVLTIIGLIAAVTAPQVFKYLDRSKAEATKTQIRNVQNALELFYMDIGRYPTQDEGLNALAAMPTQGVAGWMGPYIRKGQSLSDAWGTTFTYSASANNSSYELKSLGRDHKYGGSGTDADIVVTN